MKIPETKQCTKCGEVKLTKVHFYKRKNSKSGYESQCKSCRKQADKARRNKIKEYILNYAMSQGCIDCGEINPLLLEFDHVDGLGEKEFSIAKMSNYSLNRIKEEMEKCVVRCVCCHRLKTAIDFNWYEGIEGRDLYIKEYRERQRLKRLYNEQT